MSAKRVLIIHGWGNDRPVGHWHRRLAANLRQQGHVVAYPQLPSTQFPVLSAWLDVVTREIELLEEVNQNELVVVTHSLGCLTWINLAMQGRAPSDVSRVLMVAPPDPALCDEASTFQVNLADPKVGKAVRQAAKVTLLIGGDVDPWLPNGLKETFGTPLDIPTIIYQGGGHMSPDDQPAWGPWQGVIDWVNDPKASLLTR